MRTLCEFYYTSYCTTHIDNFLLKPSDAEVVPYWIDPLSRLSVAEAIRFWNHPKLVFANLARLGHACDGMISWYSRHVGLYMHSWTHFAWTLARTFKTCTFVNVSCPWTICFQFSHLFSLINVFFQDNPIMSPSASYIRHRHQVTEYDDFCTV